MTDKHSDKRKQRLEFYREIKRMEPSRPRLIKEMIEFYENLIMAKTEIMKWISAIKSLLYCWPGIIQANITDGKA